MSKKISLTELRKIARNVLLEQKSVILKESINAEKNPIRKIMMEELDLIQESKLIVEGWKDWLIGALATVGTMAGSSIKAQDVSKVIPVPENKVFVITGYDEADINLQRSNPNSTKMQIGVRTVVMGNIGENGQEVVKQGVQPEITSKGITKAREKIRFVKEKLEKNKLEVKQKVDVVVPEGVKVVFK